MLYIKNIPKYFINNITVYSSFYNYETMFEYFSKWRDISVICLEGLKSLKDILVVQPSGKWTRMYSGYILQYLGKA